MKTKKLIVFLLTFILILSIPFSCLANPIVTSKNTELGTVTGRLELLNNSSNKRIIVCSTETTKAAPTLGVSFVVMLYANGEKISDDEYIKIHNSKKVSVQWMCSDTYNDQALSAFGCHEAQGKNSLVMYTSMLNF